MSIKLLDDFSSKKSSPYHISLVLLVIFVGIKYGYYIVKEI